MVIMVTGFASPAFAKGTPEQVYAKSAPTAAATVAYKSQEHRAALSDDAKDMKGYEPSLYRGKWFDAKWESTRKCIMTRESHQSYHAENRSSSAKGAYQFLDNSWRDGLVFMMLKESKKTKDGLRNELKKLFDKPIQKWNRYYQDRAFYTAWRHGEGKKHWYYAPKNCW